MSPAKNRLTDILEEAVALFGTQEAAGRAIGLSGSRYSRIMAAESPEDNSLGVANCLRLALVTKRHPSDVLRSAGKADVADLIEQVYGGTPTALTDEERQLLYDFHALDPDRRETIRRVFDLAKPASRAKRRAGNSH